MAAEQPPETEASEENSWAVKMRGQNPGKTLQSAATLSNIYPVPYRISPEEYQGKYIKILHTLFNFHVL
jgi:hypothetical protein